MTARLAPRPDHTDTHLQTRKLSVVRVHSQRRGASLLAVVQLRPVFSEIVTKAKAVNVMVSYAKTGMNAADTFKSTAQLHHAYHMLLESRVQAVTVIYRTAKQLRRECFERLPHGVRHVYSSAPRMNDRSAPYDLTPEAGSSPESTGTALLTQHQELLSIIDETETVLATALNNPSATYHAQLVGLLSGLIEKLEFHFEAEGKNLDWDLEDAPELRAEFQALDAEHPQLLEHFRNAAQTLQQRLPIGDVASLIQQAIDLFRDHEAREDALFAWD